MTLATVKQFWQRVRAAGPWYHITLALTLVVSSLSWYVWHHFGADQTIPAGYLITAHSLMALNLGLSLGALLRESFAAALLAGTALTYELLIVIFLYLI